MKNPVRGKRKKRPRKRRNRGDGAGNCYSRMHRSEGRWRARFALPDHAKQKKPADPESAGEEKIQSLPEASHTSSRDKVSADATENCQTPFRFSPCQPHDAASSHRYRGGSNRLQKS